jgi:DNA-binding transcriptional MerR regulator
MPDEPRTKKLKMKDLERATGVGREAIRFYIREGLLPEPERPARNVAWYDESFVERIVLIKRLQHESYLPLSVIKSIVAGEATPSPAEVRTLLDLYAKLPAAARGNTASADRKLSELAKSVGLPSSEILAIAKTGAIEIVTRDGDQWLDARDAAIVATWAESRAAGYREDLGYTADTLRTYVEFCRWLVREELRQFTASVTGKTDPERAQRMAEFGIKNSGEVLRLIHERVLLETIAQGNVPAQPRGGSPDGGERDVVGE